MSIDLYITVGIIIIGIFLFIKNYFSVDTTSILIMSLFIVAGVLSPEEGFSGFNHPATITLGCMFVISSAIFKTGLIEGLSVKIVQLAKIHYLIALLVFCAISAFFSAFINDSAVVALLIPIALKVCRETNITPSKLLLPISFSALFGGTCTLIGTSTNILVSSYAQKHGLTPFGMFELSGAALCLLAGGFIYIFVVSPFLLPAHHATDEDDLVKSTEKYTAEIQITEQSNDDQKPVYLCDIAKKFGVEIIAIFRGNQKNYDVNGNTILRVNDILKILISPDELSQLKTFKGYKVLGDDETEEESENALSNEKKFYETVIPYGSDLAGNTLRRMKFRNNYNASVMAIRHRNETARKNLSDIRLREGDLMLLYTGKQEIKELINVKRLVLLSEYEYKKINYKKAIGALLITAAVIAAAAFKLTSILISGMLGCLLLVTTSILKPKEAYDAIEWKVIFMMAGVLSMGKALEVSGGAQLISTFISTHVGTLNPQITLSIIFLITFLATNFLSSKATAALMAPIVISLASVMQINERPFLVGVMFACSLTFMSPLSYPTNTMVFAPGNYTFKDYLKFGTPLNILIWVLASFVIPYFFPF